jgi:hypothetical protein
MKPSPAPCCPYDIFVHLFMNSGHREHLIPQSSDTKHMAGIRALDGGEHDSVQRFLDTEDFTLLEKPLNFTKTPKYNSLLCCLGAVGCVSSVGIAALFTPIGVCCPSRLFPHMSLEVRSWSLMLWTGSFAAGLPMWPWQGPHRGLHTADSQASVCEETCSYCKTLRVVFQYPTHVHLTTLVSHASQENSFHCARY